jgi:hypothetical protein
MNIDLSSIGITPEELQSRVVDSIADSLLSGFGRDPETGEVFRQGNQFRQQLDKEIQSRLDQRVSEIGAGHIYPAIAAKIETLLLQKTNEWGEAQGEGVTFVQYLVNRAERYLSEEVDGDGRTAQECRTRGNTFYKKGPRLVTMIDKHLQTSIESAMKTALKDANSVIVEGIAKAAKDSLKTLSEKLSVVVTTK